MFRMCFKQAFYLLLMFCLIGCATQTQYTISEPPKVLKKETEKNTQSYLIKEPCHFKENKPRPS